MSATTIKIGFQVHNVSMVALGSAADVSFALRQPHIKVPTLVQKFCTHNAPNEKNFDVFFWL
jgi:hypothetical protein